MKSECCNMPVSRPTYLRCEGCGKAVGPAREEWPTEEEIEAEAEKTSNQLMDIRPRMSEFFSFPEIEYQNGVEAGFSAALVWIRKWRKNK